MASQDSGNGSRNGGGGTATDTFRDAGQELLGVVLKRAASSATDRVSDFSDRLTNVSENGESLRSLVRRPGQGDRKDDSDDDGDERDSGSGFGSMLSGLKDKVKGAFGGSKGESGGKKKIKLTNIVETIDVGLPLRTTYDLWTRYTDFPTFMKKVESVTQPEDEVTQWKAQIFLSHREWEATTLEQVPDSHIIWRAKGAKGHVDGAVTFAAMGPNMTRVALVLEYHPQGLFERTGNLWRAQGRRARLEFKHFRRHAMTQALLHPDEVEGWRGEIHDGEVVKTHEEAMEEEQEESGGPDEDGGAPEDEDYDGDAVAEDDDLEPDEDEDDDAGPGDADAYDDDEADMADEDEAYEDEGDEDEGGMADEDGYDEADDAGDEQAPSDDYEDEDEDEAEPPAPRRRRRPVGAGAGRRGARS
jgi:hypothetical protein